LNAPAIEAWPPSQAYPFLPLIASVREQVLILINKLLRSFHRIAITKSETRTATQKGDPKKGCLISDNRCSEVAGRKMALD
jgi:hypothetical protein